MLCFSFILHRILKEGPYGSFLLKFFIWKGKRFAWFSFPAEKVKSKIENCHSLIKTSTYFKKSQSPLNGNGTILKNIFSAA